MSLIPGNVCVYTKCLWTEQRILAKHVICWSGQRSIFCPIKAVLSVRKCSEPVVRLLFEHFTNFEDLQLRHSGVKHTVFNINPTHCITPINLITTINITLTINVINVHRKRNDFFLYWSLLISTIQYTILTILNKEWHCKIKIKGTDKMQLVCRMLQLLITKNKYVI